MNVKIAGQFIVVVIIMPHRNASSRSSTQVKQHWTRTVLGWETTGELKVLLALVPILMMLRGKWSVPPTVGC